MESVDRPRLNAAAAKWGTACAQCAVGKAKCIRSDTAPGSKCDRCERLAKACSVQVHRPRKKRQTKLSKTTVIEDRLDDLVKMLKTSGRMPAGESAGEASGPSSASTTPGFGQEDASKFVDSPDLPDRTSWTIPEIYNNCAPESCVCRPASGTAPPPPGTDDELLDVYRNDRQKLNPFVIVPPGVTATELKKTRPFLLSAIRMVTSSRSLRSMRAQMYYLMRYVADRMLIRSERTLDLLLGIIVIIHWYQYHCYTHGQLTNLIGLASTLVGDLGLHRNPSTVARNNTLVVVRSRGKQRHTEEEKRALLGAWFSVSTLSLTLKRIAPMRFTRYMQECLDEIEKTTERPTDVNLVYIVRIQHLAERVHQLNYPEDPSDDLPGIPTTPPSIYLAAFQTELDRLRYSLPPDLKHDIAINVFLNAAALRLHEPPVLDASGIISLAESLETPTVGRASPIDLLYQSRQAIVQFYEHWLSVPMSEYYHLTTLLGSQFLYASSLLSRWAQFTAPVSGSSVDSSTPGYPTPSDGQKEEELDYETGDLEFSANQSSTRTEKTPAAEASSSGLGGRQGPTRAKGPMLLRDDIDPRLPGAVAALKSRIQAQPGLLLDVSGIFNAMCVRFDEAHVSAASSSSSDSAADPNVYSMGAMKMRVTVAKLERWADVVTARTEALTLGDHRHHGGVGVIDDLEVADQGAPQAGTSTSHPQVSDGGAFDSSQLFADQAQGWGGPGAAWPGEFFLQGDPMQWIDESFDWGAAIMDTMGNLEQ